MRIGVDMQGAQSQHTAKRGIGRYARGLLHAMTERAVADGNDYLFYVHPGLPTDSLAPLSDRPNVELRRLPSGSSIAHSRLALEAQLAANRDRLDAFLILSPIEAPHGHASPAKPINDILTVSIVYDLIRLIRPAEYLRDPGELRWIQGQFRRLAACGLLLAISQATRRDCLEILGCPPERVHVILAGVDEFFKPAETAADHADDDRRLARLGIAQGSPFLLAVGGADPRKNLECLIHAHAQAHERLAARVRLVLAGSFATRELQHLRGSLPRGATEDQVLLLSDLEDDDLRALYRRCALFVSPSLFEGFGLPIAEAMRCGAVVVAGNNSAQPEVVGPGGVVVDVTNGDQLARAIGGLLDDPARRESLRAAGRRHSEQLTWQAVADRALAVIEWGVNQRTNPTQRAIA